MDAEKRNELHILSSESARIGIEPLGAFQLCAANGTADKNVRRGAAGSLMSGYNFATTCREVDMTPRRTEKSDVRQGAVRIGFLASPQVGPKLTSSRVGMK